MPETLLEITARHTRTWNNHEVFVTAVPGLTLLCTERPRPPSHRIFKPALCVVVQGAKWTTFGNKRFDYRAGQALVVTLEMPSHGRVVEATPEWRPSKPATSAPRSSAASRPASSVNRPGAT